MRQITHRVRPVQWAHESKRMISDTSYLDHLRCLLSSSLGPSWSPLPGFLCWAAAVAAAGSPPARTGRSPPRGPRKQPGPGRRWSLAAKSLSSSRRRDAVPERRSKNVTPGCEVQPFQWAESQTRAGRREILSPVALNYTVKARQYRKMGNVNFKIKPRKESGNVFTEQRY